MICEVGQGIMLPKCGNSPHYTVRIQFGEPDAIRLELETKAAKESNDEYSRWNERFEKRVIRSRRSGPITVSLMDEHVPVCKWQGRAEEFLSINPDFRWVSLSSCMKEEKCQEDHLAGIIQLKVSFSAWPQDPPVNFKL